MKKAAAIILGIIGICGIGFITSCIADDDDDDSITAPTVYLNNNGDAYDISFAPIENMQYANVFRQRSSDKFVTVDETVNIGQVIPADLNAMPNSFIFEDAYVNNTNGTGAYSYRYFIRFWNNAIYSYTKTSEPVDYLPQGKAEAVLNPTSDIKVLYVRNDYEPEKNYTLYLQTSITVPDGFGELHTIIGINNKTAKKPFLFASRDDDSGTYTFPGNAENTKESTSIDFHKVLPAAFFDTSLSMYGFIGVVKIGYKGDDKQIKNKNYTNYYWTKPSLLVGTEDGSAGQINYAVRDDTGEWEPTAPERESDNSIKQYPSTARDTFVVPSIKDPENEFDYSNPYLNRVATQTATPRQEPELDITPYNP